MATASVQPAPLAEINTTPLIDVTLVLLVMMVLSVPAATNSLISSCPTAAPRAETLCLTPLATAS